MRFLTSAFGARGSSSFGWNFLFHAEFRDEESGLYDYGYRYYAPDTGRWLSRDPLQELGGSNFYAFVQNDSLNRFDYLGMIDSVTMSLPQLAASGMTAAEIAELTGVAMSVASAAVAAVAVEKAVENFQRNAKGKDPCEKAKNALKQARKGIESLNNLINDHQGWINNPSSYPGGLDPTTVQQKGGIEGVKRGWQKQIAKQKTSLILLIRRVAAGINLGRGSDECSIHNQ